MAVDAASGARLAVPRGWERLPDRSLVLALGDWTTSRGPRPTLRLLVLPVPEDADVAEVGLAAVAEARSRGHAIASDVWAGPGDLEGRLVQSAHRQGTGAVAVNEWWLVRAGVVTCVRATCAVDMVTSMTPAFLRALDGLVPAERVPPSSEEDEG